MPGLAKTLTIKTTAAVLGGTFHRVQFTPDLVPSDLVGTRIYRPDRTEFEIELGPVFCNFLLADEINRAPAKVQSALLEVMQEHQVTIGHTTFPGAEPVPRPRDPESDRVGGHLPAAGGAGRPLHAEGARRLPGARRGADGRRPLARAERPSSTQILSLDELIELQRRVNEIYVDPALISWTVEVATATRRPREHGLDGIADYISYGASPRGPISLVAAGRALALIRGRDYVVSADLEALVARRVPAPARAQLPRARRGGRARHASSTRSLAAVPAPQLDLGRREAAAS